MIMTKNTRLRALEKMFNGKSINTLNPRQFVSLGIMDSLRNL
jgi:hypothetical protein